MAFPYLLSLSRFAPRMHLQQAEVLRFEEDALVLSKRGRELARHAYPEIDKLKYHHYPTTMSRTFQFMSGNLFQRRQAHFRLRTGKGPATDLWLETDLEFRTNELVELFRDLYQLGVPLEEYSHAGNRLFLLESMGQEEIDRGLDELQNDQ